MANSLAPARQRGTMAEIINNSKQETVSASNRRKCVEHLYNFVRSSYGLAISLKIDDKAKYKWKATCDFSEVTAAGPI